MGRERLSDEGVFVQWVQIYQLSTDSLRSVLGTYQKVYSSRVDVPRGRKARI